MKPEHKQILEKLEDYLSHPEAEHLRFWQALFNAEVVVFEDRPKQDGLFSIKDDYNISDKKLLERLKHHK